MSKAEEFTARLLTACRECRAIGYTPVRFEQMVHDLEGVATAKRLVASGDLQDGLIKLAGLGRLDLSMESIMQEPEFRMLFTSEELEAANWRLEQIEHR